MLVSAHTQTASGKTGPAKPRVFFGYLVVFALILSISIPLASAINAAGIFYTPLSKEFHTSTGTLSYYTSFVWGAGLISLPFMGKMLDKVDARICVGGSCLLIALDFLWLSLMHKLWQYYAGAFVMGLGVTMLNLMAPSTLVNRWFAKRAGFFVGVIMAFSGVGGLVFSTLGGSLILAIGWSKTYLVFAALAAATVPVCWFCIRSYPADKGLEPYGLDKMESSGGESEARAFAEAEKSGLMAKQAFRTRSFLYIMILCFIMNFCMYTYYIIPSYIDQLHIGMVFPLLGAITASCAMCGQTITKLAMGFLSDKKPYVGTAVCMALGICGILTLAFGGASEVLMYIGAIGYGFFHGTVNVMLPVFTERAFGNVDYAKIYSRISMASCAAGLTTGLFWGTIIHLTDNYHMVFCGISALLLVGIFFVFGIYRANRRKPAVQKPLSTETEKA